MFEEAKRIMATRVEEGIKIFDPYKVTLVISDWCKHGVGYIMAQKHCKCANKNDVVNPQCCKQGWRVCLVGSRFTLPAEGNYSPTEGEMLGVVNALQKTKYFTLGCPHLYVGTDHKPLLGLLSADTSLEKVDNPRLLRLKEKTLGWVFTTIYIPGKQLGGTDALSRYGVRHADCNEGSELGVRKHLVGLLATVESDSEQIDEDFLVGSVQPTLKPVTWSDIKRAAVLDNNYQDLVRQVKQGFPQNKAELPEHLRPFWKKRDSLHLVENVVLHGDRIVIPEQNRNRILEVLHSSHQGTTGMLLRAESSMFWPNMAADIHKTRSQCRSCDIYAPSHPNMPPIKPEVPEYPFQHVCSDYFALHGQPFLVIVDRFSGWFNVYTGKGGSIELQGVFTKLFQDVGVPESLTTDGGTTYMSRGFQDLLQQYGVQHRVSSVGFPHGNTRSEVAVKSAKRLLRTNLDNRGNLDKVAVTRALLQYRNTPDRDIGLSPAEMLYGRKLKDFLPDAPDKYKLPSRQIMRNEWKEVSEWREKALARRCSKVNDTLSEHTRDLPPLSKGDNVLVQNQLGNSPKRWERRGRVVDVLPHRQYQVLLDGSRRLTLRNRQFLRKFTPLDTSDQRPRQQHHYTAGHSQGDKDDGDQYRQLHEPPDHMQETRTWDQEHTGIPALIPHHDPQEVLEPNPQVQFQGTQHLPPDDQPQAPAVQGQGGTPGTRLSRRLNKGFTSRYDDFHTGAEYDEATANSVGQDMMGHGVCYETAARQGGTQGNPGNNTQLVREPCIVGEIVGQNQTQQLYAIPLPANMYNRTAWWTGVGWAWS